MPPEIEGQLYNDYLRPLAARVIRKIYDYLSANVSRPDTAADLQGSIPIVGAAVQRFESGDYGGALQQAYGAYRYLTVLRSHRPDLPALDLGDDS
jgi:hypothetical protein